jgi:hypothetical protein
MPGDFSAAIDIKNSFAIIRTLFSQCALSGGIDRGML